MSLVCEGGAAGWGGQGSSRVSAAAGGHSRRGHGVNRSRAPGGLNAGSGGPKHGSLAHTYIAVHGADRVGRARVVGRERAPIGEGVGLPAALQCEVVARVHPLGLRGGHLRAVERGS